MYMQYFLPFLVLFQLNFALYNTFSTSSDNNVFCKNVSIEKSFINLQIPFIRFPLTGFLGPRPPRQIPTTQTTTRGPPIVNEDPAVSRFREYLRIDTSHPNPNYEPAVRWLKKQAQEIGLEFRKHEFPSPALFVVSLTWRGSKSNLKSIMLNSHMDVVTVDKSKWKYDPFSATKESNGNIYARGAQDRKHLGTQYLEAIRRLKNQGFKPLRNIHVTFAPDEEVGGSRGIGYFVKTQSFKDSNIGFVLDEGGATPGNTYAVYYGERTPWRFKVTATGRSSHGALMLRDNAGVKLNKVITKLFNFREEQLNLIENENIDPGLLTSINLSQIGGGLQPNIVPSEMWAVFDMRIKLTPNWQFPNVESFLDKIIQEAGPGVKYDFLSKSELHGESILEPTNIWWTTFQSVFTERNLTLEAKYFLGATDARYIRNLNITALNFSPLPNTEPLQHQDNEFINEQTFLDGIKMYELIIPKIANIGDEYP